MSARRCQYSPALRQSVSPARTSTDQVSVCASTIQKRMFGLRGLGYRILGTEPSESGHSATEPSATERFGPGKQQAVFAISAKLPYLLHTRHDCPGVDVQPSPLLSASGAVKPLDWACLMGTGPLNQRGWQATLLIVTCEVSVIQVRHSLWHHKLTQSGCTYLSTEYTVIAGLHKPGCVLL